MLSKAPEMEASESNKDLSGCMGFVLTASPIKIYAPLKGFDANSAPAKM